MKRFALVTALLILLYSLLPAQILNPVKWKISSEKVLETEYDIVAVASIEPGWHIYGTNIKAGGPIATSLRFKDLNGYEAKGKLQVSPKPVVKFDENFNMNLELLSGKVTIRQRVVLTRPNAEVKGSVEFMSCDDSQCLPPDEVEFSFALNAEKPISQKVDGIAKQDSAFSAEKTNGDSTATLLTPMVNMGGASDDSLTNSSSDVIVAAFESSNPQSSESLLSFFIIAVLAGLASILTPCVFPMIPMTVSFFIKKQGRRGKLEASIFGLSIIFIYTVLGVLFAVFFGADGANWLSTHWIPNLLFFAIFVFFAFSFFGMFEITLPSWMVNKTDAQVDRQNILGPFFMALTTVLVSFSCTGPIVGSVLVSSAGGQLLKPIIGMLGFSLAFAVPFTLFALFPSMLDKLPKSGGWLNSVKVVLGFLELALGLKFLMTADQTYHWGLLDREIYLAIWIVLFTLMGFYLLGKLRFAHDSEVKHIGVPRLMLAIATFSFVVYLIPGLFGAPLKAISGYIPPMASQDFDVSRIVREQSGVSAGNNHSLGVKPRFNEFLHLPHGLQGFFDINEGLAYAQKIDKPVFIDFTGHGCNNCREMEARVWSDPRVLKLLQQEYVLVALYVDDKTELPQNEWVTSSYDGKLKKTIGKINSDYQITRFKVNAQPFYVLMDSQQRLLTQPMAYNLNVDEFIAFLKRGIEAYKNK